MKVASIKSSDKATHILNVQEGVQFPRPQAVSQVYEL